MGMGNLFDIFFFFFCNVFSTLSLFQTGGSDGFGNIEFVCWGWWGRIGSVIGWLKFGWIAMLGWFDFWYFFLFLKAMSVLVPFWGMSKYIVSPKMQEWLCINLLLELVGQGQAIILSCPTRIGCWNLLNTAIELVHCMLNSASFILEADRSANREGYLGVKVISNLFPESCSGLVGSAEWIFRYLKPWYAYLYIIVFRVVLGLSSDLHIVKFNHVAWRFSFWDHWMSPPNRFSVFRQ